MKKIILLLTVICALTKVNSQPYQSIFSKHTSYNVLIQMGNADPYTFTDSIFVCGDTIINGLMYQKFTNWFCSIITSPFNPYSETETFYIREDTTIGKVYGMDIILNKEILLMDMSLSVGDTFVFQKLNYITGDSLALLVDSVVYVNGKKNIIFKGCQNMNPFQALLKIKFIEGVSPTNSLFAYQRNKVISLWNIEHCVYLLCHHDDNGTVQYAQPYYGCIYDHVGISEFDANNKLKINVFQNPASDIITVNIEGFIPKKSTFSIYNILGEKLMFIENIETNIFTIHKNNLSNGVYFYEFKPSKGNTTKGKLLIN